MLTQIIALLIATAIPALAFWIIYRLDMYKTGEFRVILASAAAGIAGFFLASLINRTILNLGWLAREDIIRYAAPVLEEILKGLLLLYLIRRPNFTYFVEGAIYGFAAGMGFAIAENWQYVLAAKDAGLAVAIGRVLSTNLIHAATTALLGIALGLARFQRSFRAILFGLGGLLAAVLMHMAFNNLVTRVKSGILLIYAAACGLAAAGMIVYAIKRGLKEEKAWIEQTLGAADRVTSGEAAVVQSMDKIDKLLKPMEVRFGKQKTQQAKEFLIIQARLGLLRKSLEKLSDERMKKSIEDQMGKLRGEMDVARRKVGTYAILYLRRIFPEDSSPLWGKLESILQERAARPTTSGINVFARAQSALQERKQSTADNSQEKSS